MAQRLYTIKTLLDAYPGLNEHTARRAIKQGRLQAHQLLGDDAMLWITQEAVDSWLSQSVVDPAPSTRQSACAASCAETDFDFDY